MVVSGVTVQEADEAAQLGLFHWKKLAAGEQLATNDTVLPAITLAGAALRVQTGVLVVTALDVTVTSTVAGTPVPAVFTPCIV